MTPRETELCRQVDVLYADLWLVRAALLVILDAADYTCGNCCQTEMVGAVLPKVLIANAREALKRNPRRNCARTRAPRSPNS